MPPITFAFHRAVVPFALVVATCKTPGGEPVVAPVTTVIESRPAGTPDTAQQASDIADAIDPGPLPALSDGMPNWLLLAIGIDGPLPDDPVALTLLADTELATFTNMTEQGTDANAMLGGVTALARAAVYSERAAAGGVADSSTLARLERVYNFVDVPAFASDRNMFAQMLRLFASASVAKDSPEDANRAQQLGQVVFSAIGRAGPLRLRAVALLLRADLKHEGVPRALLDAADEVRREDDALAIRMGALAIELRGRDVEATDFIALANLCHRGLDLECGAWALDRTRALAPGARESTSEPTLDEKIKTASETSSLARRVVELRDAKEFDPRLERARALLRLGRAADSNSAYLALRSDYPQDARPVAGLARNVVGARMDLQGANAIIDDAGPLDNADAEYYEIAIGTRATALLSQVVPAAMQGDWGRAMVILTPLLARMDRDIGGYQRLGNSDGRFLRFLFDTTVETLPLAQSGDSEGMTAIVRGLLPRAVALHLEIPSNEHAYRLMLLATQFSADRDAAFAAARRPVPLSKTQRSALLLRRIQALSDLAVVWDDAEIARHLDQAIAAIESELPEEASGVLADARAISARLHTTADWHAVTAAYQAVVGDPATTQQAAALNNLGVALAESGDLRAALPLWERAAEIGESWGDVAKLNLVVKRRGPGDLDTLKQLAETGRVVVRVAASAWLVEFAPDRRTRRAAEKTLRALIRKESPTHVRPVLRPGTAGIVLEGSLNVGLGYSMLGGLEINLDSVGSPWLTFPPPVPIVDPRVGTRAVTGQ